MPTKPGALGNASVNEPNMGLFSAVLAQGDRLAQEFIATVALLDGDAVVMDPATGPNNVTKAALADTTRRVGVCMGGAAVGAPAWIVMKGPYPAISDGTAVAVNGLVATSAATAGQIKASAAAAGHTVLGIALVASPAAGARMLIYVDPS